MFGINVNYLIEVFFLIRLVNKFFNIDIDVELNVLIRGEFVYLLLGVFKILNFDGKVIVYVDDFEVV